MARTTKQRWHLRNDRVGEIDPKTEAKLRKLIAAKRRAMLVPHGPGRGTAAEKLNRKRFSHTVIRKLRIKLFDKEPIWKRLRGLRPEVLLARYRSNEILNRLIPGREAKWQHISRRQRPNGAEVNLKQFSFIHYPVETLAALKKIAEAELSELKVAVHFCDTRVMDIGPYLVLAEIWPLLTPIFTGGMMSPPIQKVIEAVRLRRRLRMAEFHGIDDLKDVWAFPIQRRHGTEEILSNERLLRGQQREKVADEFCDWINDCLGVRAINRELTDNGRIWVVGIIAELLDNAERHSAPMPNSGDWSVAGFMAKRPLDDGKESYVLSITILSVGASIAESLSAAPDIIRKDMDAYCVRHKCPNQSIETLRTVYALKDYVTRDQQAAGRRGGIGFQEVFEFANALGKSSDESRSPKLIVISGNSCISVTSPYMIGKRDGIGEPRQIWFNDQNMADIPPSPKHVYNLDIGFPGTVIGLWLTLDPENLNRKQNE